MVSRKQSQEIGHMADRRFMSMRGSRALMLKGFTCAQESTIPMRILKASETRSGRERGRKTYGETSKRRMP